jgi:peptidoglycan/xylan/chitin deacetylase (PgdA/CDA1 family)
MTASSMASLSLDLDNCWSYLKTRGDPRWETFPSYLDVVVPRVLEFFARRALTLTFFVVGQDAALKQHHAVLRAIAEAGHEVGNHSFHHEPWLHRYDADALEHEIALAEDHIERATSVRPVGFRGPGFSVSAAVLATLASRGYSYDASTFPTFIGPLARAYYFMKSDLGREARETRSALFGTIKDGMLPLRPYLVPVPEGRLLEIPVSVVPFVRLPFHLSYILYLATFSRNAALVYFRTALGACRIAGVQPSLLLHPLDFLGKEDDVGLEFFPGMNLRLATKLAVVDAALHEYQRRFRVVTMLEHARTVLDGMPVRAATAV